MHVDHTFLVIGFFASFLSGFIMLGIAAWDGKREFLPCLGFSILGFLLGPIACFILAFADDHRRYRMWLRSRSRATAFIPSR
ncbi:MAG: hypothetical protein QM831_11075 [Kofleriaceae bacterium]